MLKKPVFIPVPDFHGPTSRSGPVLKTMHVTKSWTISVIEQNLQSWNSEPQGAETENKFVSATNHFIVIYFRNCYKSICHFLSLLFRQCYCHKSICHFFFLSISAPQFFFKKKWNVHNIFIKNPKCQIVTDYYYWGKKVILVLGSNLNQ